MLVGQRREALEELERGDRAGRIVRVVDPNDRRSLPRLGGNAVEIRQEGVLLEQGQIVELGAGEERAALVDRVAGLGREDKPLVALSVQHDLREVEDRLLAAVGRDHLGIGIELDAEAARAPGGNDRPQLGQSLGERVAHQRLDTVDERFADQRIGLLARVALAEVDQLDALAGEPPLRLFEADEGIGAGRGQDRR